MSGKLNDISNLEAALPLRSHRLHLRPFQKADLQAFATYRSEPAVARYQSWSTPFSLEQAAAFLSDMVSTTLGTPGAWYQLAVERAEEPGIIGDCAFQVMADDDRQAQVGFTLSPSHQQHGYATEAVTRLLEFLFCGLNLHRVTAICDVRNVACIRLLDRVGMRREAHHVENHWMKGEWSSEYVYALRRTEWSRDRDRSLPTRVCR